MRDDDARIADILAAAETVVEYLRAESEEAFAADARTVDAAFYNVMMIGEAVNTLLADADKARRADDARIVSAHPEIPWRAWVGMRNVAAHQYFRRSPALIWRDFASGEYDRLARVCRDWLARSTPASGG